MPAVVGTQRNSQNQPYSSAEIGAIATSHLDVIANPCPGGQYYGFRTGRNASSDPTRNTGFVMKLDGAGDYSGDKKVEQSLSGMASQKIRVA